MKANTLSKFPGSDSGTEVAQPNWVCGPCGQTRDSDPLARANFDSMTDMLDDVDPLGSTWEIVRFGHWAVGWIDEVFIQPDSPALTMALSIAERLDNHPVLDEELLGAYIEEDYELDEDFSISAIEEATGDFDTIDCAMIAHENAAIQYLIVTEEG